MFDKLAYSVGFFLGDGCLHSGAFVSSNNGKTYYHNDVIFVCSDLEPIRRVQDQIAEAFGKKYNMQTRTLPSGTLHYTMAAHRREIFDFFSVNTAMRFEVPAYYFSASRDVKLELCRGLMDTDGFSAEFVDTSIDKRTGKRGAIKRWQVGFSNGKLPIVQGFASIMQSVGVKMGKISTQRKAGYREVYNVNPNPRSFHEAGMFFYASRKQAKFDRYVAHVLGSETLRTAPVTSGEDIVPLLTKAGEPNGKTAPTSG
jgi:hypothetical protein